MYSRLVSQLFQDEDFLKLNGISSEELFGYLETVVGLVNRFQKEIGIIPSDVFEFCLVEDVVREKTTQGKYRPHREGLEFELRRGGLSLWRADTGEGKSKSYACLNQIEQVDDSSGIISCLNLSSWGYRMVHENVHNTQYQSLVGDCRLIGQYVKFVEKKRNSKTSQLLEDIIEEMAQDMQSIYENFEYLNLNERRREFSRCVFVSPRLYLNLDQEVLDVEPITNNPRESEFSSADINELLEFGRVYLNRNLARLVQFFELDEAERTEANLKIVFGLNN